MNLKIPALLFPQKVPSPLILCALDCTLYNSKLVRWAPLELYRVCPRQELPKDTFSNTILEFFSILNE